MAHRPTNANAERVTTTHISAEHGRDAKGTRASAAKKADNAWAKAMIAARIAFPAGAYKAVSPSPTRPPAMKTVNRGAAIIFAKGDMSGTRENTHAVTGAMGIFAAVVSAHVWHSVSARRPNATSNHACMRGASATIPKVDAAERKNDNDSAFAGCTASKTHTHTPSAASDDERRAPQIALTTTAAMNAARMTGAENPVNAA